MTLSQKKLTIEPKIGRIFLTMARDIVIQKFGGTSVGSPERIKAIAKRIVNTCESGKGVVVVVSAMGDTTDELISLTREITETPDPREYDALISTGENISAALLAMAIQALGKPAISLTGRQAGVRTESTHSRAKILTVDTQRILSELSQGKVVVVTGFQGFTEFDDITTIGRGGSDTSAVVLAASLGVDVCEIFTDVDGIYTTDPRKVTSARKLESISYEEMLELASLGAKVLHPRAVECAKENGVKLHVRSSFEDRVGTLVEEAKAMEGNRAVTGATLNESEAEISILKVPDHPGVAGMLFEKLAHQHINVDMIIQTVEENQINNITFTVGIDDLNESVEITKTVAQELKAEGVVFDDNISKLSIVGVGMISKPGVAAQLFKVLGDLGINIRMISTSEIKVSCIIDKDRGRDALNAVHEAFSLDKDS